MHGNAVRWDERSYIPNLHVEHSSTLPAWLLGLLPGDQGRKFERVTTIDIRGGPAHPADLERCLVFQHVDTIRLGTYQDADALVDVFCRFPRLKRLEVWNIRPDGDGKSIAEAAEARLRNVVIVVR